MSRSADDWVGFKRQKLLGDSMEKMVANGGKGSHAIRFWVSGILRKEIGEYWLDAVGLEDERIYGILPQHRRYEGELLVLCGEQRCILRGRVGSIHLNSRGWFWCLHGTDLPVAAPFLLTNELNVKRVFEGVVELEGNEKTRDYLADLREGEVVPLEGEGWFGVFSLMELLPVTRGRLLAFGTGSGVVVGRLAARWIETEEMVWITCR